MSFWFLVSLWVAHSCLDTMISPTLACMCWLMTLFYPPSPCYFHSHMLVHSGSKGFFFILFSFFFLSKSHPVSPQHLPVHAGCKHVLSQTCLYIYSTCLYVLFVDTPVGMLHVTGRGGGRRPGDCALPWLRQLLGSLHTWGPPPQCCQLPPTGGRWGLRPQQATFSGPWQSSLCQFGACE